MDSRKFDGVWGFPACPIHLHEECACIFGRRDWGRGGCTTQGIQGSRCILLTVTSFTRDTCQNNKQKVMFYMNTDLCASFNAFFKNDFHEDCGSGLKTLCDAYGYLRFCSINLMLQLFPSQEKTKDTNQWAAPWQRPAYICWKHSRLSFIKMACY